MKNHHSSDITRRKFIGQASCAALGTSGLLSSLLTMGAASRVVAQTPGDYKALICLFLAGGNDSYNMLTPWDGTVGSSTPYGGYVAKRGGLWVPGVEDGGLALEKFTPTPQVQVAPANRLVKLISAEASGPNINYGLHSAMKNLATMFNATGSKLAFAANVGTMMDGSTNATNNQPVGLFSHSDQIEQWQTGVSDRRTAIGWAGRMVDVLHPEASSTRSFYNISLSGTNILQSGRTIAPYSVTPDGVVKWNSHNEDFTTDAFQSIRQTATDSLMNGLYRNIFEKTYAAKMRGARDNAAYLVDEVQVQEVSASGNSQLDRELLMVAHMIDKLHTTVPKQTFFVRLGGFDTHDEVINNQQALLSAVDTAVFKFWTRMGQLGLQNNVTLFTASDFGRTLSSNGNGSDHGWGGNHFVLGGAVNGGRVYGSYPDMQALGALEMARGRLAPTNSVEQYLQPMLSWFGVPSMNDIFPTFSSRFGNSSSMQFMT